MCSVLGYEAMQDLKKTCMEDYLELTSSFERKKRSLSSGSTIVMTLPLRFRDILQKRMSNFSEGIEFKPDQNKLRVNFDVFKALFDDPVLQIVSHVRTLLRRETVKNCKAIVMVGGFSESFVLQEAIKQNFLRREVIIPREAGLAVLKGAALYGYDPVVITERICRFTYGVESSHESKSDCKHRVGLREVDEKGKMRCYGIFSIHARLGQVVKLREEQPAQQYSPLTDDQESVGFHVFRSSSRKPELTTDPGCEKIGHLNVPLPDKHHASDRSVTTTFLFGGTEIVVNVTVNASGESFETRIDFLD